jgi:hypothetical protein
VLRPQVRLVEGRMFQPGTAEIIAGRSIADGFQGPASARRCASPRATGLSSACSTPGAPLRFGDLGRCRADAAGFPPPRFSALIFRLADSDRFDAVKKEIESDPRLTLEAKRETPLLRRPIRVAVEVHQLSRDDDLGHFLDRRDHRRDDHDVRERRVADRGDRDAARARLPAHVDPRRVPRRGADARAARRSVGLLAASFMQALSISTTNFQTFAEIAFLVPMTPTIVAARSRSRWRWASSGGSCRRPAPRA